MDIIVTRPEDDAPGLAAKIAARGQRPVLAPLMRIAAIADAEIPARDWQAVALTSANAVKVLAGDPRLAGLTGLRAYVVGPASAAAAREAGFHDIHLAEGGDLASLTRLIAAAGDPAAGPVLYLSGEQISGDLKGQLEAQGFSVHRAVLYRALAVNELPAPARAVLMADAPAGVVIYSARSARIWRELAGAAGLGGRLSGVVHFCLSQAVADALGADVPRRIAARPDEARMLDLIAEAETPSMTSSDPHASGPVIDLTADDVTARPGPAPETAEQPAAAASAARRSGRSGRFGRLAAAALALILLIAAGVLAYARFGDQLFHSRTADELAALETRMSALEQASGEARAALTQLRAATDGLSQQLGEVAAQSAALAQLKSAQDDLARRADALDAALKDVKAQAAATPPPAAAPAPAPGAAPPANSAAAAALRDLTAAYQAGGDAAAALDSLDRLLPGLAGAADLKTALAAGVPQQADLLAAADSAQAALTPPAQPADAQSGWWGFLSQKLRGLVKITPAATAASAATLARARDLIAKGDYAGAAAALGTGAETESLAALLARRIAADKAMSELTAAALKSIAGGA